MLTAKVVREYQWHACQTLKILTLWTRYVLLDVSRIIHISNNSTLLHKAVTLKSFIAVSLSRLSFTIPICKIYIMTIKFFVRHMSIIQQSAVQSKQILAYLVKIVDPQLHFHKGVS